MNSQMERVVHGDQEEHRHAAVHNPGLQSGGEHPHDEKKSVLKKVKAKAKKIKDTITKHGHHEHGHEDDDDAHHHHHHHEGDYDDDEDAEKLVDPEIHGAPIYESKEVRTYFPEQVTSSVHHPDVILAALQPTAHAAAATAGMGRHYGTSSIQNDAVLGGAYGTTTFSTPISVERRRANISNADPADRLTREPEHNLRDHRSFIPGQVGVSKHNDVVTFGGSQTPEVAHTGGAGHETSTGTSGIMDRRTDLEPDPQAPRRETEPSNYQSKVQDPSGRGGEEMGITQILHSLDKMGACDDETKQRRTSTGQQQESVFKPNAGSHETEVITDKGISVKNAVASKLGYGGERQVETSPSFTVDYGKNMASTVYEKLADAGGAVMSKMPGSHATAQTVVEKVSPGEEDKALSDVISEKLHKAAPGKGDGDKDKDGEGKVTFSAKVVRQLGSRGEESAEDIGSGISGPAGGGPMVDMLKDTVTSWLGLRHDNEPSSLVWHDIPKDGNEGLSEHDQGHEGLETERKTRTQ
ncbi:hypothetical protein V2J09_016174 [Rumex salicifolius]